ncbi:MAG TPA: SDR family oxidoreductase [Bacteroidales bacterium]|nr:SDR family oxidoreductase [Bacteroidales bacterium]
MNFPGNLHHLLDLSGQTALVSGGASGIGAASARLLALAGARIVLADVDAEGMSDTAARIIAGGGWCHTVPTDVRDMEACEAAARFCLESSGTPSILVNSAGLIVRQDSLELSEEAWDLALDVCLKGAWLLSRAVLPHMITAGKGSIVHIGSGWSLKGGPRAVSYCAAKGGLLNMTRAMAIDHGPQGIRVNCLCPGDTDTPLLWSEQQQLGQPLAEFRAEASHRPLGRMGTADDIARAVLFLCSPMASWISGTHLLVDGGGLA